MLERMIGVTAIIIYVLRSEGKMHILINYNAIINLRRTSLFEKLLILCIFTFHFRIIYVATPGEFSRRMLKPLIKIK